MGLLLIAGLVVHDACIFESVSQARSVNMNTLHQIEHAVSQLSPEELAAFRAWFAEFDAAVWDQQFEVDVAAGRLDALAEKALQDLREERSPQEHFNQLEAILQRHAEALEAQVRALQQSDETAQWPTAWKQVYNWHFAKVFARQKIFRNWAADAAAWKLLPERVYPNRGNHQADLPDVNFSEE